ncbi:hypothetical protein C1646_760290 [Rhizophagus diaphanus]|nr:hypothetical protein C1646_760290 [Rhizophagus diaphanus] [Rhizophagus sp. MUCL 43196]
MENKIALSQHAYKLSDQTTKNNYRNIENEQKNHTSSWQSEICFTKWQVRRGEIYLYRRKKYNQTQNAYSILLRQAFLKHNNKPFDRRLIILFGNFGQLPFVLDLFMYNGIQKDVLSNDSFAAYKQF